MIAVHEALSLILDHNKKYGVTTLALQQAVNRTLAEDVRASRDLPPFNRVMMDGIAIRCSSFDAGNRSFTIEAIQAAGQPVAELQQQDNAIEVMTGAMLPKGTDAVIPYEECTLRNGRATVDSALVKQLQHVHVQGADGRAGDVLLPKGSRITPGVTGVLASEGCVNVAVSALPTVAVCSSGDELVDLHHTPQAWQIRRSNSYMLAASLQQQNIDAALSHLPDDPSEMISRLSALLKNTDVVLFSGAISKGKFDFLPDVLQQLGMQTVFQGVAQKPGKPFMFGVFKNGPLAFCFPGNPVSTFVCYHYYFKRWLHQSTGINEPAQQAILSEDVQFKPSLTYHLPVKLSIRDAVLMARPVHHSGSGDLTVLAEAQGILTLPAGKDLYKKGEPYDLLLL